MSTSMHSQPSPVTPQPPRRPMRDPEPESRLAQDAIPYQGPSRRNYAGRMRLMFAILGVFLAVCIVAVVRVLTHGAL